MNNIKIPISNIVSKSTENSPRTPKNKKNQDEEEEKNSNKGKLQKTNSFSGNASKMGNFLEGLDNYIDSSKKERKSIFNDLEQKQQSLKKKNGDVLQNICYSSNEKKEMIDEFNQGIKNFYTYKGSGKEFLQKNLKKKMEQI